MQQRDTKGKAELYDAVIVGGGPAGLTAAIYLARARYRVLLLEKEQLGGQITITHEVVNYPGIDKISGSELTEAMRRQAESFGAQILIAEARELLTEGDVKTVRTDKGDFRCLGILVATGARPRSVGFIGEEKYKGRGVAYCATCDGEFFTGREIFVIGGGYAAAEESVFLTKFATRVTVLMRGEDFSCPSSVAEGARKNEKITVINNTTVEEVSGEDGLNYIRYKNIVTGKVTEYRARDGESFGVFVFAGYTPDTAILKGKAELDERGYVVTDREQRTSLDGVYAAGDVCIKPLRQVVTATGEGALAATELEKYVAEVQRRTGIFATPPALKQNKDSKIDGGENIPKESDGVFSEDIKEQLRALFAKLNENALLKLYLDKREISKELEKYIQALSSLSDKLEMRIEERDAPSEIAPCVKICRADGTETGLAFHGVPGGHEFTSFVLGIYNALGEGQLKDEAELERIRAIRRSTDIKLLVTLSCSMCPDTVVAAQLIAAKNPLVSAEVYDILHFEELRKKYKVMSVPCIVINDSTVSFGKKNLSGILELVE